MAKVTNVTLDNLAYISGTDDVRVQIQYQVEFLPQEVGQTFRIEVDLVESDLPGDDTDEPILIEQDPDTLYTISFSGIGPFKHRLADEITVTVDQLTYIKIITVAVDRALLNEDPGFDLINPPLGFPHHFKWVKPHTDEIQARVRVAHEEFSSVKGVPA